MAIVHSASQLHAAVEEELAIKVCDVFAVLRFDRVLHQSSQLIFQRVREAGWM